MYAFTQDVPIKEDLYARIRARLGAAPLEGLIAHLVVRRDDGRLRYIDATTPRCTGCCARSGSAPMASPGASHSR